MPVADTELLFLLNPKDPRHHKALKVLEGLKGRLFVPDVALLEFEITLKSRGRRNSEIRLALLALKEIFETYNVVEVETLNTLTLAKHLEIMDNYGLSFFDSLIAAATLSIDGIVVSDDRDFDSVPEIKRIPITH
ncbi:MAG: hypothetical protein B6U76_06845 [Desulfurococcales archaeon ex4484_217_2]|nr:MAG: hypothetical protein B6U76_06845 [Desulfurococcales archaeon ex4484_217_2]